MYLAIIIANNPLFTYNFQCNFNFPSNPIGVPRQNKTDRSIIKPTKTVT